MITRVLVAYAGKYGAMAEIAVEASIGDFRAWDALFFGPHPSLEYWSSKE